MNVALHHAACRVQGWQTRLGASEIHTSKLTQSQILWDCAMVTICLWG